ncbi:hypothetical protein [Acidovorax sp. Leaf78]|uniref:hypothetical protein n=1 Tax=unclassified Acidovorax TaxID=2684926 RepID=UPI0006F80D30|nr:hypothetical protein [Acidovorax sp. Leaf78]KQO23324.1 hypothetical protein ASF16_03860 [Acidovorax sp. Leaf78]
MDTGLHPRPHRPAATPHHPATLTRWQHAAQRARSAQQLGQWRMAMAYQHQALALSLQLLERTPPAGHEDDCIAAAVVSHLNVADLQAEAGELEEATQILCRAHTLLLGLMADARHGVALQQAAWRHSRETHAALLRHVQTHGAHPLITHTLAAAHAVQAVGGAGHH